MTSVFPADIVMVIVGRTASNREEDDCQGFGRQGRECVKQASVGEYLSFRLRTCLLHFEDQRRSSGYVKLR